MDQGTFGDRLATAVTNRRGALVMGALGAAALMLPAPVEASGATLKVCESGPPKCEYSQVQPAIEHAPDGATIQIAPGTYRGFAMPDGDAGLTSITLKGAGAGRTTISGGGPVVTIGSDVSVSISGVTITGGSNPFTGGGIFNEGTLTLTNCIVSDNTAKSGGGIDNEPGGKLTLEDSKVTGNDATFAAGGIYSSAGTATLIHSVVRDNTAEDGGGIFIFRGTVSLTDSTVSANRAGYSGLGGGIYNANYEGTLTLEHSTVSDNTAGTEGHGSDENGGGIYNSGTAALTNSTLSDNRAAHTGGGIFNRRGATLTFEAGRISGNAAGEDGGGIDNPGAATLTNSKVIVNTAGEEGGGIYNLGENASLTLTDDTVSGNSAVLGGGIYNYSGRNFTDFLIGTLTLANSTVSDNTASQSGGGIYNSGTATLTNSKVSGNTAKADGGGIYNLGDSALTNSTVRGNTAEYGGGIYNVQGYVYIIQGGVYRTEESTLTLEHSKVRDNHASVLGGGIDNVSSTVTLEESKLIGNSPEDCSGTTC